MSGVVVGLGLALALASQQRPVVFGSEVRIVRLDVSVTRDGTPVEGLTADNFRVKDNGVQQAVTLAQADERRVHALLVLDTSGSVSGTPLRQIKDAARAFVAGL
jgi:hypothetical protein